MDLSPEDKKVIDLLSKLKNSNGSYPSDILTARRQAYLKQVANVGLGVGINSGLKNVTKIGNGSGAVTTTITSKILETALIAAIAVEAGAATYLYRDKLANLVKTYTHSSSVQEVGTLPSNNGSSVRPGLIETLESPSATITTPSNTPPVTPSGTPGPELAGVNNNGTDTNINATPKPGGDNGNHYGQTPKPERTQDNNNNNNGGNNNGGGGSNNNGGGGNKNKP